MAISGFSQPMACVHILILPALGPSLVQQCPAPVATTPAASSDTCPRCLKPLSFQITPSCPWIPGLLPFKRGLPPVDLPTLSYPFYLSVHLSSSLNHSLLRHSNHPLCNNFSLLALSPHTHLATPLTPSLHLSGLM